MWMITTPCSKIEILALLLAAVVHDIEVRIISWNTTISHLTYSKAFLTKHGDECEVKCGVRLSWNCWNHTAWWPHQRISQDYFIRLPTRCWASDFSINEQIFLSIFLATKIVARWVSTCVVQIRPNFFWPDRALAHNDRSIQENHHIRTVYVNLASDPSIDLLQVLMKRKCWSYLIQLW